MRRNLGNQDWQMNPPLIRRNRLVANKPSKEPQQRHTCCSCQLWRLSQTRIQTDNDFCTGTQLPSNNATNYPNPKGTRKPRTKRGTPESVWQKLKKLETVCQQTKNLLLSQPRKKRYQEPVLKNPDCPLIHQRTKCPKLGRRPSWHLGP